MDGTGTKRYDKLVRDKIPLIIIDQGKEISASSVSGKELSKYIKKKLNEELAEFTDNPCLEEAADILEILNAYFIDQIGFGIDSNRVRFVKNEKFQEKGGFDKGIILHGVK